MADETASDLQRELEARLLAQYRDLQRQAAERLFHRRHGRPPADANEITAGTFSGTVQTVDPARYLSDADVSRILASTASTATGGRR